jgi:DNA polymerase-3 subunit gamma/tau
MSYQVFARQYRPQTFEQMVGQKALVQTLQNAIRTSRIAQAYLFSGMRGVGKTTAARILAKALNCAQGPTPTPCNICEFCRAIQEDRLVDVLEIDGASNTGIDNIRDLRDLVQYKAMQSRYRVIIIDEVHQISKSAFNALLKTLEEPPEKTVFIFATTEFQKVPATIVSRCQHFEFKRVSQKDLIHHLTDIAEREKLTVTPYGFGLIARASEGSIRDSLSLLDQAVAFCGPTVGDADLKEILGAINRDLLFEFSSAVLEEAPGRIFPLVEKVIESGYDLRTFLKELILHFRDLLLVRTMNRPQDVLAVGEDDIALLRSEANKAGEEDLLRCLQALQNGEASFKFSSHPQIAFETLLVKLCHYKKIVDVKDALAELEALAREPRSAIETRVRPSGPSPSPTVPKSYSLRRPPVMGASGLPAPSPVPSKPPAPPVSVEERKPAFRTSPVPTPRPAANPLPSPPPPAPAARDREADGVLQQPNVKLFMDKFKARVVSVEPVKPPRTDEEE